MPNDRTLSLMMMNPQHRKDDIGLNVRGLGDAAVLCALLVAEATPSVVVSRPAGSSLTSLWMGTNDRRVLLPSYRGTELEIVSAAYVCLLWPFKLF